MSADTVLAEIKNLHTYFYLAEGVVRAVDGVDLTIKAGRTLGIVGESGCGKSITALSLMQLVPSPGKIEEGEITYYHTIHKTESASTSNVIEITKLKHNSHEMRAIRGNHISMVFQEPMAAMLPVRTVGAQIMEAIMLHQQVNKAEARERAIDILARAKLPNADRIVDTYPFQLSGGMRQRAVIAMALSCNPNLLIADEPTTALDVTTEAQTRSDARTAAGIQHGNYVYHAQPGRDRRDGPGSRGDVYGQGRRAKRCHLHFQESAASLHAGAAQVYPAA